MKKTAVLVSRSGTLLQAMIDRGDIPIQCVIADRQCQGIERARDANLKTIVHARTDFSPRFNKLEHTLRVMDSLDTEGIELVAMAGYMTILDWAIFRRYDRRIINIHPSLLPSFKGKDAVAQAHAYGVHFTGTTIHYATAIPDEGEIIAQYGIPVDPKLSVDIWRERIKKLERVYYPEHIKELMSH